MAIEPTPPPDLPPTGTATALDSRLTALMFTDIVDSTGIKARAGTAAFTASLKRHNAIFEQAIAAISGASIIKHTGDGYFAVFPTASEAVHCALRFQRDVAAEPWKGEAILARAGIHIGEIAMVRMADRTDVVGTPADAAARIMSLAVGGQVLLSGAAAENLLGIRDFVPRKRHGLYKLKGVEAPVEIWEVADSASGFLTPPAGALDAAERPDRIGPYRILETLGEGGMGTVYKAEQRLPVQRMVALKVIKLGMDSVEVLARFDSERQALARMDHPNVAKVLDAGKTKNGQPYFAMEYVPGVPITKFADDKKLSIRDRLELFKQVCSAIAHAHTKAIIHRDVKAGNVLAFLFDGKPVVKVIDFGIAKALTGDRLTDRTFNTNRGQLIGTYESMSPEQADGSPDIDTRTDVYSLGVLLYELLSGAPPFDKETLARSADHEIRRIIREVEPPRPSTRLSLRGDAGTKIAQLRRVHLDALESELRTELEWIPLMAMRKERDRRYASPLDLSADIQNYLDGRPLRAGPESTGYRVRKFLHRNKGKMAAAAVILFLLVGGIIGTSWGLSVALRARTAAEVARQSAVAAQQSEEAAKLDAIAHAKSEQAAKEQAIASANEAHVAQALADKSAYDARLRLAEGLVSQGDALAGVNRWSEARSAYEEAYTDFGELKVSPFRALAAMSMANAASPPPLLTFRGHTAEIDTVAISPDGRTALSSSDDHTLKLWDLATGEEIRTFTGHNGPVNSVAISPDGRTALSSSDDHTLKLWDLATGEEIRTFTGHNGPVNSVAISPDGRTALSGSSDKTLKVWDLATGKDVRTISANTPVWSAAISPDGKSALSSGEDGTIRLWDLADGKLIRTLDLVKLDPNARQIFAVAFSPDGRTALSGDLGDTVRLWDLATGRQIRDFQGHTGAVGGVVFSPDGRSALSASGDETVRVWDIDSGKTIYTLVGCGGGVALTPDGRFAMSGSFFDNTIRLWSLNPAGEVRSFAGKIDSAKGVRIAVSPDGRDALSCSYTDSRIKLWDLATGKDIRTLTGHTGVVLDVAFSPNGRLALSASSDKTIKLWDLASGKEIRTLTGHTGAVLCVAISPDGRTALSGSDDHTLKLWDLAAGKEIRTLSGHTSAVTSVAFNQDGRTAWSAGSDSTLRLWNLASGEQVRNLNAQPSVRLDASTPLSLRAVAFNRDGRFAVSAEGIWLSLWDLASGKEMRVLRGTTQSIWCVAISPDGHTAVSGGYDHGVKVWDLETGKEIRTLNGHTDIVSSVAFTSDGQSILSAGVDGTLKLWNLTSAQTCLDFQPKVQQAQAALQKNPDDPAALAVLGEWYAFRGVTDWAVEFLEKARAGGATDSSLTLARCYWELSDNLPPKSNLTREGCLAAAASEFSAALAASHDTEEQADIRLCLSTMQNTAGALTDAQAALRSADTGDPVAMYQLGRRYRDGDGVAQSYQQAMQWFVKAAAAGNVEAMYNIGYFYNNGSGVTVDYREAMRWYLKAAAAGNASAMYNIGRLYRDGKGMAKDGQEAMRWFVKAAAAGNATAMYNIGYLYHNGTGVAVDYQLAMQWYLKAAAAGSAPAMFNIGRLYRDGRGVAKDDQQAMLWFSKAAAAGNAGAENALRGLTTTLPATAPTSQTAR
jgi:eukaryotic-like serine/threonine-protein kinase